MRIVEIIPNLQVGGAERFVTDLSNSFVRKGHEIVLVTLYDRCRDHVFEDYLVGIKRVELHKRSGLDFKCLIRVFRLIKQIKPVVVHAHGEAIKYLLFSALLYNRCNYYATVHSDAKFDSGSGLNFIVRSFLYKSHIVRPITISNASHESFVALFNINPPVIENGCTTFIKSNEPIPNYRTDVDFLFVHVASIQQVKNQIVLVESFQQLIDKGVKARLLFFGRPYDKSIYIELEKYWSDKIVYLGQQSNIRDYMVQADAFCLSSTIEGLPITVIEALSVGCIPLVTPAGGCVDIIKDGYNGLVADAFSTDSYLSLLEAFIAMPVEERRRMRTNALSSFEEEYSIDGVADKYLALFAE